MDKRCLWICAQKAFGAGSSKPFWIAQRFGSLARFFEAGRATWNQLSFLSQREMAVLSYYTPEKAQALLQYTESLGQKVITPDDEEYPESLRHLEDAPAVLYTLGRTALMQEELCIGMVGTRKASENGKKAARFLARDLAEEGTVIVSGGAMGIDTAAHQGAMEADGATICVLGCGIGYPYLVQNEKMRREIVRTGGLLLSEYSPDTGVERGNFPVRNRLIAGLSRGVLVIEAGEKSGALITARLAGEQGKDVFAVPAGIMDPNSQGVNSLIKDGAKPVTCAQDILEEYKGIQAPVHKTPIHPVKSPETESYRPDGLSEEALAFFQALSSEPRHITEICAQTSLSIAKALSVATELELCGFIQSFSGRRYAKI